MRVTRPPPATFSVKKTRDADAFPPPNFHSPLDDAVELKKQIPATIRLYNSGNEEIAFKIKTTEPRKYCVLPNRGFVKKGETVNVQVTMEPQREWPADMMNCKDKFLVQSCPSGGSTEFTELFVRGKEDIKEQKLKVSYSQPAPAQQQAQRQAELQAQRRQAQQRAQRQAQQQAQRLAKLQVRRSSGYTANDLFDDAGRAMASVASSDTARVIGTGLARAAAIAVFGPFF